VCHGSTRGSARRHSSQQRRRSIMNWWNGLDPAG
jgi:hypothetical protein